MQQGTNYALTTATSGTGVSAAAMTPDGRFVVYAGILSGTTVRLYVWDTLAAARIYTNAASVSYTHLDVYKRQRKNRLSIPLPNEPAVKFDALLWNKT